MKLYKLFFTLLLGSLLTIVIHASLNISTFTFTSQTQLDSLYLTNSTLVSGNLIIRGSDIKDLSGLSKLDSVTGGLTIAATSASNIDGLSKLTFIGGGLTIDSNAALQSINGLSNLDSLRGGLTIVANSALTDIDGLSKLDSVIGGLTIRNNPALININGLSKLDSVTGGLTIKNNPQLANISGLSNLKFVGGGLTIDSIAALLDLNWLSKLDSVTGGFAIRNNLRLADINGLSKLDSVAGGFTIAVNPALANIDGLSNLKFIEGGLTIDSNYALLDIGGLSKLDSVSGDLKIIGNSVMAHINGLLNLRTINGGLTIDSNYALLDIGGLSKLDSVGGSFAIKYNIALQNINGLSRLDSVTGGLTIAANSALTNIDGLSNLTYVRGDLNVQNNTSLTEFCGLFALLKGGGLKGAYNVTGNKLNPTQQYIISGSSCNASTPISAVILGTNSVWFEATSQVHSGNVIVNKVSGGPTLDAGVELSVGLGVQTPAGYSLKANRIKAKLLAKINGDVYYNQLSNQGHIIGSLNHPLALPVYSILPQFHHEAPGTQNITVPNNGTVTLTAGNYQDVIVKTKGTLLFSGGGTFSIHDLNTESKVKLLFDAPTEVLIKNRFDTDVNCFVGPKSGSSITASDIVFYVAGINGNDGNLNSSPKSAQVGLNNEVLANFYVPNGTLWLTGLTNATGAFIAKDVRVGLNVDIYEKSAFDGSSSAPKVANSNAIQKNNIIAEVPKNFMLSQNYPNPFNPSTTIKYALPENEKVAIEIYDILGRKVAELVNGEVAAGYHEVEFNASNLASGIYLYRLSAGSFTQINKMLLMK